MFINMLDLEDRLDPETIRVMNQLKKNATCNCCNHKIEFYNMKYVYSVICPYCRTKIAVRS